MSSDKKKNVVFILGAGATTHWGPPVMRDFMRIARHRYSDLYERLEFARALGANSLRLAEHYIAMLEFHMRCERSSPKLLRDWNNIEELYTQADFCRLAGWPKKEDAEAVCNSIAWVIWDVYRALQLNGLPPLKEARNHIHSANLNPVFITTNYDLFVEMALSANEPPQKCYCYPGFQTQKPDTYSLLRCTEPERLEFSNYHERATPIIKLHGSVNWFRYGENKTICHSSPHKFVDNLSTPDRPATSGFESLEEFYTHLIKWTGERDLKLVPEIVPPMLGKTAMTQIVEWQWRAAIEAIAEAEQIWIVGYSFPQTDAFMQRLLHEGLSSNRGLDWLCIVDIQARKSWKTRLTKMLNPVMLNSQTHYYCLDAEKFWLLTARRSLNNWMKYCDLASRGLAT